MTFWFWFIAQSPLIRFSIHIQQFHHPHYLRSIVQFITASIIFIFAHSLLFARNGFVFLYIFHVELVILKIVQCTSCVCMHTLDGWYGNQLPVS